MTTIDATDIRYELYNGNTIPALALATDNDGDAIALTKEAVKIAVKSGYRHITTLHDSSTEVEVGQALKELFDEGVVKREDMFITSTVGAALGDDPEKSVDESLAKLGLDYIDLLLQHAPIGHIGEALLQNIERQTRKKDVIDPEFMKYIGYYQKIEELHQSNPVKIKNIGTSNYSRRLMYELKKVWKVKPVFNQIKLDRHLLYPTFREWCYLHGILIGAYSPLESSEGPVFEIPKAMRLARLYDIDIDKTLLSLHIEHGNVFIPKTTDGERITGFKNIIDFRKENTERPYPYYLDDYEVQHEMQHKEYEQHEGDEGDEEEEEEEEHEGDEDDEETVAEVDCSDKGDTSSFSCLSYTSEFSDMSHDGDYYRSWTDDVNCVGGDLAEDCGRFLYSNSAIYMMKEGTIAVDLMDTILDDYDNFKEYYKAYIGGNYNAIMKKWAEWLIIEGKILEYFQDSDGEPPSGEYKSAITNDDGDEVTQIASLTLDDSKSAQVPKNKNLADVQRTLKSWGKLESGGSGYTINLKGLTIPEEKRALATEDFARFAATRVPPLALCFSKESRVDTIDEYGITVTSENMITLDCDLLYPNILQDITHAENDKVKGFLRSAEKWRKGSIDREDNDQLKSLLVYSFIAEVAYSIYEAGRNLTEPHKKRDSSQILDIVLCIIGGRILFKGDVTTDTYVTTAFGALYGEMADTDVGNIVDAFQNTSFNFVGFILEDRYLSRGESMLDVFPKIYTVVNDYFPEYRNSWFKKREGYV